MSRDLQSLGFGCGRLLLSGTDGQLEEDAHPGIQNHCLMERRPIRRVDKHLHIRPDFGVLRETQPVKGFEDIFMWLAEIGGARKRECGREHIAPPAKWMRVGEARSIGHAQGRTGRSCISEASKGNQAVREFMVKLDLGAMTAALVLGVISPEGDPVNMVFISRPAGEPTQLHRVHIFPVRQGL